MDDPTSESVWEWCRAVGRTKGKCDVRHIYGAKGHHLATACVTHGEILTFGGAPLDVLCSGEIPLAPESRAVVSRVAAASRRYECLTCHAEFTRDGNEWNRSSIGDSMPECWIVGPVTAERLW